MPARRCPIIARSFAHSFADSPYQGNIDPVLLLGSPDVIRHRTRALLETMKKTSDGRRCILNLGHGILPGTPPETVAALVETVQGFT